MSVTIVNSSFLGFTKGTSDKVYHLYNAVINGKHCIIIKFGRRGSNLRTLVKEKTDSWDARTEFNKLDREKFNEGYRLLPQVDYEVLTDQEKMYLLLKY